MPTIRSRLEKLERSAAEIRERNAGCGLCSGTAAGQRMASEGLETLAAGTCPECGATHGRLVVQVYDVAVRPKLIAGSPDLLVIGTLAPAA